MDASADEAHEGRWAQLGRFLRRVPRQARSRSVVRAILAAAEESLEIAEHGPLQPLFARAGVAAGSFYEYFASRDALLGAVVEHVTDRNFETFLAEIDDATAADRSLEPAVRHAAEVIVRHYLSNPTRLRALIRLVDRLGMLVHVGRERDRFADALSDRVARFAPEMPASARSAMMRAAAEALTGVVVVSSFRAPPAPLADVVHLAGDVAWGVIQVHLGRTRDPDAGPR